MMKSNLSAFALVVVLWATLAVTANPASAGIIVTPDHISSGSATGTLLVVDVPFVGTSGFPKTGGPVWTDPADTGFKTEGTGINEVIGSNDGSWEPDGTPVTENQHYNTYDNAGSPDVSYTFDIPDDSIINAIYATWRTRGSDGGIYSFTEGATSDTTGQYDHSILPNNDLGLDWIDSAAGIHTAPFELIFSGPLTVTGGDGFTLFLNDTNADNAMSIDAVVVDFTAPAAAAVPEPASIALWLLMGLGLAGFGYFRLRRQK